MASTYLCFLLVVSASMAIGQTQQDFPGNPAGRDYPVLRGQTSAFRHPPAYSNYPYGRSPSVVSTDRRRQFGRTNAASHVSSVVRIS